MVLDKLPPEYDARVKAMEVDEKPTEDYSDIGGLDKQVRRKSVNFFVADLFLKQIEELREAVVLPITHKDLFEQIGIKPPKGVLMYGPPGTGTYAIKIHPWKLRERNRENTSGAGMCCTNEFHIFEACWSTVGANVHWRWGQTC